MLYYGFPAKEQVAQLSLYHIVFVSHRSLFTVTEAGKDGLFSQHCAYASVLELAVQLVLLHFPACFITCFYFIVFQQFILSKVECLFCSWATLHIILYF